MPVCHPVHKTCEHSDVAAGDSMLQPYNSVWYVDVTCVLQYVAVCCSVLQCVAVCCSALHCVVCGRDSFMQHAT